MPRLRLRFEALGVEVAAADPADLRWLEAFLACGFESLPEGRRGRADVRVELAVDAAAYDRLARGPAPGPAEHRAEGPQVEGFAGDAKRVFFERLRDAGPDRLYRDTRMPILYRVSGDARRVAILARGRVPKLRRTLMRVVRELAMGHVVASGGLILHASAVHRDGGVVAICGPKRSGKTSLLCALLGVDGVAYVANDRCALHLDGDGARLRGVPTLVKIRGRDGSERPGLHPAEFCAARDVPGRHAGPLAALIFPSVGDDAQRVGVRRLAPAEAAPLLRAGLFRAGFDRLLGEVFTDAADPALRAGPLELLRPLETRILETLPCFACRLGGAELPDARDARTLLDRLRDARPGAAAPYARDQSQSSARFG